MNRAEREEFLKILQAHQQTIEVCEACAMTTRDLAAEVARSGAPSREQLMATIAEAERVLADLEPIRAEVRRLIAAVT
jgi:hypothetical protein